MHPSWHPHAFADRLPFLRRRARLTQATRAFFGQRGYTEVETPYAVATPGEEVHLQTFSTVRLSPTGERTPLHLHNSPEFAMKRLLVAGVGPIYQLARVWRNGEGSDTHSPEFTMLEWYRPGATLDTLMDETEALLRAVLPPTVTCRGVTTDFGRFERLRMTDAFAHHAGADLLGTLNDAPALAASARATLRSGEGWEDLFFRLLLERVEPALGRAHPTFLTHWPAAQGRTRRARPGRPARGAAVRAVRLRPGTGQRLRGTDRRGRAARPLRSRPRQASCADRSRLAARRGFPGRPGPRHALGLRQSRSASTGWP